MTLHLPWRRRPIAPPPPPPAVVIHGDDSHSPAPGPPIPVGPDRCTCGGQLNDTGTGCTTPGDPT